MAKVMRKIIEIDEEKCDGCGLCIPSCAEGALQVVEGKARLVKDIYCDGLGNCLGECPQDAISIVEREAEPFDEAAVDEYLKSKKPSKEMPLADFSLCSASAAIREVSKDSGSGSQDDSEYEVSDNEPEAELSHWPVQIHLINPQARFLQNADLLIAADCVPFAYANFHKKFLAGRVLLVGCPKLDDTDAYHQKLVQVFKLNQPKSITMVMMEVGCCFGLSRLVNAAATEAGLNIPINEVIVNVDGTLKN